MTMMRGLEKVAMASVGVVLALLLGCESGTEVTGIDTATPTRNTDGTVAVAIKTACNVAEGQGRVDDTCDSDGDEACFHADWIDHVNPGPIIVKARVCKEIDHVRSKGFLTLTSPTPIPTDRPLDIYVYTDTMGPEAPVIVASP